METVERMIQANPLKVPNSQIYYEKAIKDFLMAGFTGMTAGKPWDGKEQVNGGYISVMDDGDVLCYHSNDREAFRDYLYRFPLWMMVMFFATIPTTEKPSVTISTEIRTLSM